MPRGVPNRQLPELLRRLLTEVSLQVGEMPLSGAQLGLGVADFGLFFLDSFYDP